MAVQRNDPYPNQHFNVEMSGLTSGAFSEVVLPDIRIDDIEYRTGNDLALGVYKLPGLARYDNVILRRGFTGNLDLYKWINTAVTGNVDRREVTITLLSEDLTVVAVTWKLFRAWPVKYGFRDLYGNGKDVAIEEIVIAYEQMVME